MSQDVVIFLEAQEDFKVFSLLMEPDDDIATDIAYNSNKFNRDADIIRSVVICVRTSPCEMDILLSPLFIRKWVLRDIPEVTGLAGTPAEIDSDPGCLMLV